MFYRIKEYIHPIIFIICNTVDQAVALFIVKDQKYLSDHIINYYSQWESRSLNKDIELKILEARKDALWISSGAMSAQEYQQWSKNICAIACLKMVADNLGLISREMKSVDFAKKATKYGVYNNEENREEIKGIFWRPFQELLIREYGIKSYFTEHLTIKKISDSLCNNKIVFLSVSPFFHHRLNKAKLTKRIGHVILVHGFISKNGIIKGFFVKDPGGWAENNSQECFVDTKILLSSYSGRAFIIYPKK